MTNIRQVFARNMRERRKKLRLSQERLAEKISSAANYIASIEACKQFPSTDMMEKLASALDMDTLEFFAPGRPPTQHIEDFCDGLQAAISCLLAEKTRELKGKLA